jgi:hypothetical protein
MQEGFFDVRIKVSPVAASLPWVKGRAARIHARARRALETLHEPGDGFFLSDAESLTFKNLKRSARAQCVMEHEGEFVFSVENCTLAETRALALAMRDAVSLKLPTGMCVLFSIQPSLNL